MSPESSPEPLRNICSHAPGITTRRITPGAVSAFITTTEGKPEKDRNAEGQRERKTEANVLISLTSTWSKFCTHESQLHSLDLPVSRSQKLPSCLFKSVHILQLMGKKTRTNTLFHYMGLFNVIEVMR